ncbi:MAG: LPS-assembly protein LptD [Ignavibacteriales bacterium]|nr:LPS-assembly protein LptD [Ignavibacteriales bacterium]
MSPSRSTLRFRQWRLTLLLFASVVVFFRSAGQEIPSPADTSRVLSDTSRQVSGIDTLVVYRARDSITYSLKTRYMKLYGKGDINYRTVGLKAEKIAVNWDTATLDAEGMKDTSGNEIGRPLLIDGGEQYDGARIGYNFQTKKGKITVGETEMEGGYYHGEGIKKVGKDVLFVEDGRYTTCDLDHPHFYFYSPRMKVIPREVVVAEPVFFYISDVPVFALPFGVFPNRSGRRSGLIAPAYGEDARLGRYFSHFGYYWAISDYLDLATTFDWYSRGGWANRSLFRYKLRYSFEGAVSASVNRRHEGEPGDPDRKEQRDYNIQVTHNQNIDPTSNLNVNFTFTSGSYYRNFSQNLNDILRQNIVSNATFSKSWLESNRSLSLAILRDQNLISGNVDETLPSISFSQGTFFPFRGKKSGSDQEWYETIGLSYNASGQNRRSKTALTLDSIKTNGGVGETVEFQRTQTQSINQGVQLGFSPRLGNFTVSPSLSFSDRRTFVDQERPVRDPADSSVTFERTRPTTSAGNVSASLSTSTRFYGVAQPNIAGITAFRHTVNPSLSFNYGKQVYGTFLGPASFSAGLGVQNQFEMKYQPSDTAKEQKIQLMNIGANVSYNFRAPEFRVSPLTVTYRTNIARVLDISASTVYNFYLFDRGEGRRVNKFLIKEKGYLADLTSISFSLGTTLSGERKSGSTSATAPEDQPGLQASQSLDMTRGFYLDEDPDFSIPWSLNLNFSFSQSQSDPRRKIRTASLQAQLSFNLTEQWKISASGNYDLTQKQLAAPSVQISRDLHCWIMNFSWVPLGPYRYYRLEIRVKAPQLQDIKVTKQGSDRGVYY